LYRWGTYLAWREELARLRKEGPAGLGLEVESPAARERRVRKAREEFERLRAEILGRKPGARTGTGSRTRGGKKVA
jgi:hypothetical protein